MTPALLAFAGALGAALADAIWREVLAEQSSLETTQIDEMLMKTTTRADLVGGDHPDRRGHGEVPPPQV